MGITNSYPVARDFENIKNWSWHRATSAISAYHDKGYDFGVGCVEVANILGCSENDASNIIKLLSHNPEKCNAITLLALIILISEHSKPLDKARFEHLFDLLDLSKKESITKDEFTIMLLCTATAAAVVLGKSMETSDDPICVGLSDTIYDFLEKDADHPISKDEFNLWAHENIHHMTIDKIFPLFITTTDIPIEQKVIEETPAPVAYNTPPQKEEEEEEEEIPPPIETEIIENDKPDPTDEDVQGLANEMLDGDYEFDDFESRPNTAAAAADTQDIENIDKDDTNVEEGDDEKELANEEKAIAKDEELVEAMNMLDAATDDIKSEDVKVSSGYEDVVMKENEFDDAGGNGEDSVVVGDSLAGLEKESENDTMNADVVEDPEDGVETLPKDSDIPTTAESDVIASGDSLEESYEADFDDAGEKEQDDMVLGGDSTKDIEKTDDSVISEPAKAPVTESTSHSNAEPPATEEDLDALLDELDVATAETPAKPKSVGDTNTEKS